MPPQPNELLYKYLVERDLYHPERDMSKLILENTTILESIAAIWADKKDAIKSVVEARIGKIREELELRCHPSEVTVLRQAMFEVGEILKDIEKYAIEYDRRKTNAPEAQGGEAPNQDNDNGESGL